MKGHIYSDEAYPVYGIDIDRQEKKQEVEIPDELYERYLKVEREYGEVQDLLEKYYHLMV